MPVEICCPAGIYSFKFNNGNIRTIYEIDYRYILNTLLRLSLQMERQKTVNQLIVVINTIIQIMHFGSTVNLFHRKVRFNFFKSMYILRAKISSYLIGENIVVVNFRWL